jgi:hypothetical protein
MNRRRAWTVLGPALLATTACVSLAAEAAPRPSPLPLPGGLGTEAYEKILFEFLNARRYRDLGWAQDKRIRDTGPYIDGVYYGTHPAVRIFYSPEVIAWLADGKRGPIPDGAMIIKEQFEPPAARYQGLTEDQLWQRMSSWTVMVKQASASHDGWFWSNPAKGQEVVDNRSYPFDHPMSGFGIYCLRCHASTQTSGATNEYTFAALRNVAGYPGEPLNFRVDDSWRQLEAQEEVVAGAAADLGPAAAEAAGTDLALVSSVSASAVHPRCADAPRPTLCQEIRNSAFLATFPQITPPLRSELLHLPPVTHDWVVRRAPADQRHQPFVTSNQCMSCHAGLVGPFGPTMFVPTAGEAEYGSEGLHISPYGEWRWTPMGLAGRDPIFFAQLESEIAMLREEYGADPSLADELCDQLVDTCLSCHGVMGKRQFELDHQGQQPPGERPPHFSLAHLYNTSREPDESGHAAHAYGALARDGISCSVCHHIQPREQPANDRRPYLQYFLETSITGNFHLGKTNELHGPFADKELAPYSMEHALGFKPVHNPYVKSSQMCGTCHVVNLPIVDDPLEEGETPDELVAAQQNPFFKRFRHHVEQATYLEWLNSEFENEFQVDNPRARTCQDCHMARDYRNPELRADFDTLATRMAAIQDDTYPDAENLPPHEQLHVRVRQEGYARHNFRGLNVFLIEMFNQFDDVLGVRKFDFMTGSTLDLEHAKADFVKQARHDVAQLTLTARLVPAAASTGQPAAAADAPRELQANVKIQNLVGHRFPSGVGFRRAFLELLVLEQPPVEKSASFEINPLRATNSPPRPVSSPAQPRIVWASGRTNPVGVLVGADGKPLASEFFSPDPSTGKQAYQPHHQVITSPEQVQVYETLLWSAKHQFTTSFLHGCSVVKDNRLLPRGWRKSGPNPALTGHFLEATWPKGEAITDPAYQDGSGTDEVRYHIALPEGVDTRRLTVRATLYYQAIPPYFLKQIFDASADGPAARRLHYLCSHLDLAGTPIQGWKLPITSTSARPTSSSTPSRGNSPP